MDNGLSNDEFGDESWGDDPLNFQARRSVDISNATSEGSDYSPVQLAMIRRRISTHSAPLPRGVADIQWQAPESTGLQHSSPIFQTETDNRGTLRVSKKGFESDNCHFRSWQEDNGVAATFASKRVTKVVDGHRMTVAIGRGRLDSTPKTKRRSSADDTVPTATSEPVEGDPDIERLRSLRRCSSEGEESRLDSDAEVEERGAAGTSSSSVDASNPREMPSTPQRPVDGVASSHAREPRPGRWLSSTKVCDSLDATAPPFFVRAFVTAVTMTLF